MDGDADFWGDEEDEELGAHWESERESERPEARRRTKNPGQTRDPGPADPEEAEWWGEEPEPRDSDPARWSHDR